MNTQEIINSGKFQIIDVRDKFEINTELSKGINIPLIEIEDNLEFIKGIEGPILFCCASGARSESAVHYLKFKGFTNVYNAGTCQNLIHSKA